MSKIEKLNSEQLPYNRRIDSQPPLPKIPNAMERESNNNESLSEMDELVLPMKMFETKRVSVKDISQGLSSYLWFRRIKEIFLMMGMQNDAFTQFDMNLARKDMIETCDQYLENQRPKGFKIAQDKLDRWKNKRLYAETFRMSYSRYENVTTSQSKTRIKPEELTYGELAHFDNAIWWYSCNEAPIFDQMNNILRLENFELLMCHRYFISDLCQRIEQWHVRNKFPDVCHVFRGDKLSKADFEILKDSIKGKGSGKNQSRITINGFISTSRNEKISIEYAEKKLKSKGSDVVILYDIKIDPTIPSPSYADIESISFHPREEEILFNMGATFRIDSIEDDEKYKEIKRIKMTACEFNLNLIDEMKNKVKQSSQAGLSLLLAGYIIELGEYRVVRRYLNQLTNCKELENDPNLVTAHVYLGNIEFLVGSYREALNYYRRALDLQARIQFSNNNAISEIYNCIGNAYLKLEQYDEAQENIEEGIRIQKRQPKSSQQHLPALYCTLGEIHYTREDFDEAEENFQNAYDLYNRNEKMSYDALEKRLRRADLCIAFGHLKNKTDSKSSEAKELFEEALEIYNCILPANHPKVDQTHIKIICEHISDNNFEMAIKYYNDNVEKVLEQHEKRPTTSKIDLVNLYTNIGACFIQSKEFEKGIELWKKADFHQQTSFYDQLLPQLPRENILLDQKLLKRSCILAIECYKDPKTKEEIVLIWKKLHKYSDIITHLKGQASLLLCDVCISLRNSKHIKIVYDRIRNEKEKIEPDLRTGLLFRILEIPDTPPDFVEELISVETSARNSKADNILRLRIVINDYLAKYYFKKKEYTECREYSNRSLLLKQEIFPSLHRSFAVNYTLFGEAKFYVEDYHGALQDYEKAVRILLENMTENHREVRTLYFLMADCYCRLKNIEWALNYYNQAEPPNETDTLFEDQAYMLRKYDLLSDYYKEQKDFQIAIEHVESRLTILQEILPSIVFETSLDSDRIVKQLHIRLNIQDKNSFARFLSNSIEIEVCYGRSLMNLNGNVNEEQNPTDLLERAITFQKKIILFENENKSTLFKLYTELASFYRKLYPSMTDSIENALYKALEEADDKDNKTPIHYQLGCLHFSDECYDDAQKQWLLATENIARDHAAKNILQKLLKNNEENLCDSDSDAGTDYENNSDEGDKNDEEENENEKFNDTAEQNKGSSPDFVEAKSPHVRSHSQIGESSGDDLEKQAEAYLFLGDDNNAAKCYRKALREIKDDNNESQTTHEDVNINSDRLPLLDAFYRIVNNWFSLNGQNDFDQKKNMAVRTRIYLQLYQRCDSFDEKSESFIGMSQNVLQLDVPDAFQQYSKYITQDTNDFKNLNLYEEMDVSSRIEVLFGIAEFHLQNDEHEEAYEVYKNLQNINNLSAIKPAVDFAIGKLLEIHLNGDESDTQFIESIDTNISDLSICDRIMLCELKLAFFNEIEDSKDQELIRTQLNELEQQSWKNLDLSESTEIGDTLTKHGQHQMAFYYWQQLQQMRNKFIPNIVHKYFYYPQSTLDDIHQVASIFVADLSQYIRALAENYEKQANIESDQGFSVNCVQSFDAAINMYEKIRDKDKIKDLKEKRDSNHLK